MNIKYYIVTILCCILMLGGCITTNHSEREQDNRVEIAENRADTAEKELDEIKTHAAPFAFGTSEALDKNSAVANEVAKQLNERVKVLLGNPNYEDMIEMSELVNNLTSAVEKERKSGQKLLDQKDKQIFKTNKELEKLRSEYNSLEKDYKDTAEKTAKNADKYGAVVKEVNSWFGLGGIMYGAKRFAWWLAGFAVLFFILRFASFFSPIASAIFGVFSGIVGSIIKVFGMIFSWLIPKSVELGGFVTQEIFNKTKNTNLAIIDTIQEMRMDQEKHPEKIYTVNDILEALAESMSEEDKKEVKEALRTLRWKK